MAQDDDGLIREVNEAYRQDKAKEWWDMFGMRVLAVTGAIIALTAGVVFYQGHQQSIAAERTKLFFAGYEHYQEGEYAAAIQAFEVLANQTDMADAPSAMARLYTAHAQMRLNEGEAEDGAFAQIAASAPAPLAALAAIQSAYASETDAPVAEATEWFPAMMYQMQVAEAIGDAELAVPEAPAQAASAGIQSRTEVLEAVLKSRRTDAQ